MTDNPQLAAWMAARDAAESSADAEYQASADVMESFGRASMHPTVKATHKASMDTAKAIAAHIRALPPPDFAAWQPPPEGERPDGFRCFILPPVDGEWSVGVWVRQISRWWDVHRRHAVDPVDFRPLPDAPEAAP